MPLVRIEREFLYDPGAHGLDLLGGWRRVTYHFSPGRGLDSLDFDGPFLGATLVREEELDFAQAIRDGGDGARRRAAARAALAI